MRYWIKDEFNNITLRTWRKGDHKYMVMYSSLFAVGIDRQDAAATLRLARKYGTLVRREAVN